MIYDREQVSNAPHVQSVEGRDVFRRERVLRAREGTRERIACPGIVALPAWQKPLDLHTAHGSELHGEWAFPMLSRGKLIGALACGPKRDDGSYRPDESEALFALANGVGLALDILVSEYKGDTSAMILRELTALRETREASESKDDTSAILLRELTTLCETLEPVSRIAAAMIESSRGSEKST